VCPTVSKQATYRDANKKNGSACVPRNLIGSQRCPACRHAEAGSSLGALVPRAESRHACHRLHRSGQAANLHAFDDGSDARSTRVQDGQGGADLVSGLGVLGTTNGDKGRLRMVYWRINLWCSVFLTRGTGQTTVIREGLCREFADGLLCVVNVCSGVPPCGGGRPTLRATAHQRSEIMVVTFCIRCRRMSPHLERCPR
jgi:hypothetical protein